MARTAIVGLFAVVLAIGVWFLWPRGESASPATTTVQAVQPTTTKASDIPTSTTLTSTTEAASESHVVETVEEAEEILRELWFGWFEGIYNQDEDRIREVSATKGHYEQGLSLFGVMEFTQMPTREGIVIQSVELLRNSSECLAVWVTADASAFRGSGAGGEALYVLRSTDLGWRFASSWIHRDDLWESDCEAPLESFS